MRTHYIHTRKEIRKSAVLMRDKKGNGFIKCTFPFNEYNLKHIRTVYGRKWNAKEKYWQVPLALHVLLDLKEQGYSIGHSLQEWERLMTQKKQLPALQIKGLGGTLYDYQNVGVSFIESKKGRALIADEMGLGKTVQALAWLQYRFAVRPAVIICTATMKEVWAMEARKWTTGRKIQVLYGAKTDVELDADLIIINYDLIAYWSKKLISLGIQAVIMDEIHKIKNPKAIRTKQVRKVCQGVPHVIGLSGTPIENGVYELYNAVDIINPLIFPSRKLFLDRYCDPKFNGFGTDYSGASNVEELHKILTNSIMIRRMKKDVLKELPDKTFRILPMELKNRGAYRMAEKEFLNYIRKSTEEELQEQVQSINKEYTSDITCVNEQLQEELIEERMEKANPLTHLNLLKQLSIKGRLPSIIQWIEDFLESGEKLVVFCEHIEVMGHLSTHFRNSLYINGSIAPRKRLAVVEAFQKYKKHNLFIGNAAAQEGVTLTASSNVLIIEFPWTPGALAQRIDRVHRATQKRAVTVWYSVGKDTVDEKIAKILNEKQQIASDVLQGKGSKGSNTLYELIESYKSII
jgi:SWI/SNF-related matrix-associated actin-dependent regulator of chromatin subfamily A-like protein 1